MCHSSLIEIVTFQVRPEHHIYSGFSHPSHVTFPKCSSWQLPVNYKQTAEYVICHKSGHMLVFLCINRVHQPVSCLFTHTSKQALTTLPHPTPPPLKWNPFFLWGVFWNFPAKKNKVFLHFNGIFVLILTLINKRGIPCYGTHLHQK